MSNVINCVLLYTWIDCYILYIDKCCSAGGSYTKMPKPAFFFFFLSWSCAFFPGNTVNKYWCYTFKHCSCSHSSFCVLGLPHWLLGNWKLYRCVIINQENVFYRTKEAAAVAFDTGSELKTKQLCEFWDSISVFKKKKNKTDASCFRVRRGV